MSSPQQIPNEETWVLRPRVAIIGRPNVGKSTLFNILTNSRKSVVKNEPGVTRDIVIENCEVWGKQFEVIDTGGLTEAQDHFSLLIREQVLEFLSSVDFLLVVFDGRSGLVPEDREIMRVVKETGVPFLMIVNKVDQAHQEELFKADFYEFGEDIAACAFEKRFGLAEVLEWLHRVLPEKDPRLDAQEADAQVPARIAIVGKPNVGKSSLVNALLDVKRMLVSPVAGTTIDSVDTPFSYQGRDYVLVDTAGLRRSARREEDIEIISAFKSLDAIRKADLILLVVDAVAGPSDQDARILQSILEDHKPVLLVLNKSDLAKKSIENYRDTLREKVGEEFHFFVDIPICFTSAETGQGLNEMMNEVARLCRLREFKIPTPELNEFFFSQIRKAPAPVWGVKNVKFYYLTQTLQRPPAFIAFANHPDGVDNSYRRFLIKSLKEKFGLQGMPIRIFVMKSGKRNPQP